MAKIISLLRDHKTTEIKAINDRRGTPTFAKDLVVALKDLIEQDRRGIVHVANYGCCSRYDVAREIVSFFGAKVKVTPVSSDYFGLHANQLVNECLSSKFYETRPWPAALMNI